jgi:hypothetical protein
MTKESFYFQHDYEAVNDPKIQALIGNYGAAGYGVFWRIIEMLHSEVCHVLPYKQYIFSGIAMQMRVEYDFVEKLVVSCVKEFELFQSDELSFWSERVFDNFEKRKNLSKIRSLAGKRGAEAKWNSRFNDGEMANANGKMTKERKGKERKEN